MKEQQQQKNPNKRTEKKKRVCTVLYLQNSKPKDNVYIYVLCGAVSWSSYPNFSIFKSCCIGHKRKGQELLNARGRILPRDEFTDWGGFSLGMEWESLLNFFHDCLNVVSVVQSGNRKWVHFQTLPDLLSSGGFNYVSSLLDAALGWVHEMQVRALFQKREANSWVTIQITMKVCSYKLILGLYIL